MPKPYYITLTVNSSRGECDYKFEQQDSLDAIMLRTLEMHPSATSVVMCIVPDHDDYGKGFSNAQLDPDRLREDKQDHMRD